MIFQFYTYANTSPNFLNHKIITSQLYSIIRFCAVALVTCLLIILWQPSAWGKVPFATENGSTNNRPTLEVVRYGNIEVAWVESPLDKKKLFQVAAPTVIDRTNLQGNQIPVEIRAENIEALLWLEVTRLRGNVFNKIFKAESVETSTERSTQVVTATLKNTPVVQIKNSNSSRPRTIATVTSSDVDFYSQTPEKIVNSWQEILQIEVAQIEYLASPKIIRRRFWQAIVVLLGITVVSAILGLIHWAIGRQVVKLGLKYEAGIEASKLATTEIQSDRSQPLDTKHPAPITDSLNISSSDDIFVQQKTLQRRLGIYKLLRWLLVWSIIIGWYLSIYYITTRLPLLMQWSEAILSKPLKLLAIWFLLGLLLQIAKTLIDRSTDAWKANPYLTFGETQRKSLRLTTIAEALKGLFAVGFVVLGIILTLTLFNISTSSILAGGAVIGLAISFGTQNLIKDVLNGYLILLEDRFAVGDIVSIKGMSGLVEGLNLRITQLRDPEGQLITIPNSEILEVKNLTRLWSRVNFSVEVAYENDPDLVLKVLESVAQEMYRNPDWRDKLIDPPEILGIDRLSHTGMLVRVWLKTAPLQQWRVGREYRLRVRRAFEQHGIVIGRPQWVSYRATLNESNLNNSSTHTTNI